MKNDTEGTKGLERWRHGERMTGKTPNWCSKSYIVLCIPTRASHPHYLYQPLPLPRPPPFSPLAPPPPHWKLSSNQAPCITVLRTWSLILMTGSTSASLWKISGHGWAAKSMNDIMQRRRPTLKYPWGELLEEGGTKGFMNSGQAEEKRTNNNAIQI